MSGNPRPTAKKTDRRVRRTRDRLGDALVALIQEKPFDKITVQEVLRRAKVSRSTFYSHFQDKDDLFTSDVVEFYESVSLHLVHSREPGERLLPVREFFAHVKDAKAFIKGLRASGLFDQQMNLARGHFARGIEARLRSRPKARGLSAPHRAALSHSLAGSLTTLLSWWLRRGAKETPAQMEDLFHRIAWGAVAALID